MWAAREWLELEWNDWLYCPSPKNYSVSFCEINGCELFFFFSFKIFTYFLFQLS